MATTKKPSTRKPKAVKKTTKPAQAKKQPVKTTPASRSAAGRISSITSNRLVLLGGAVFVALLALILVGIVWWYKVYTDPKRVFWNTISSNLSTRSFTKHISQGSGNVSNEEFTQVVFAPEVRARDVKQIVDGSTKPPTKVTLEAVSTPTEDYQHYLSISRPATPGKPTPDYQKVYNMWLKSDQNSGGAQIINSNLFNPILFGSLRPDQRLSLIKELQKSYTVDLGNVQKKTVDGRRTFVYNVSVSYREYAKAAHNYAKYLGLPIADQINPSNYQATDKLDIAVSIDVLSRQVTHVKYKNSSLAEDYSSLGALSFVELPRKTATTQEFQKAVNSIQ